MWCQVAIQTCADAAGDLHEVHFVLFSSSTYKSFCEAAEGVADGPAQEPAE